MKVNLEKTILLRVMSSLSEEIHLDRDRNDQKSESYFLKNKLSI